MSHSRVAILISGGGSNMLALVDSMEGDHPARPCLVLADRPGAGGLAKAARRGVSTAHVERREFGADRAGFEAALTEVLRQTGAEIVCLAGFMRILSPEFVAHWQGRMLNIHPSLLPKFKGLDTHARALAAGETEHGCTVHEVTARLDDGPVLGQARVPVLASDTPGTLAARVLAQEHRLYPLVLRRFASGDRRPVMLT